jgi:tetratricopeptide (TPR) repeat protein
MRVMQKYFVNIWRCSILCIVAATGVSGAADDGTADRFNARIQRKSGRWLAVQVVSITNNQLYLRMKGAEMVVKIKDLRGFNWSSPTPMEVGELLINSNQFDSVLARLAIFKTKGFLEASVPTVMQRKAIVKLIADAYIGKNRLQEASDILAYIAEDAAVVIRRVRIYKALKKYDTAITLARKYTAPPAAVAEKEEGIQTEAKPARQTGSKIRWSEKEKAQLYYELGTSLVARKEYEAALDELLKIKVLYRDDMDLVAQCEMGAVDCYRGLHEYSVAVRALSNIINKTEYHVVKADAETALNTLLLEFEKEKELKRRIGGE